MSSLYHLTDQDTDSTQVSDSTETRTRNIKGAQARLLKQPVVIPCLEKAAEYTNDAEWRDKLIAAARNRFPPGFYHRNNTIYHHFRGKDHEMMIPEDPMEAAILFINFLQKFGGFYSDRDVEYSRMNKTVVGSLGDRRSQTWTDCTKQERHKLISDYAHLLVQEYELDEEAYEQVNGILRLGVLLGIYCSKKIHMEDGAIVKIKDLKYDPDTKLFSISPKALASKKVDFKKKRGVSTAIKNPHLHPVYMPRRFDIPGEWRRYLDVFHTVTQRNDKEDFLLPGDPGYDQVESEPEIKTTKDLSQGQSSKSKITISAKGKRVSPGRKENRKIPVKPNVDSDGECDFIIVD